MPPQDRNGNIILKSGRYLRLIATIFTLLGTVLGGATVAWHNAVEHGRELQRDSSDRDTMHQVVLAMKEFRATIEIHDRRIWELEQRQPLSPLSLRVP